MLKSLKSGKSVLVEDKNQVVKQLEALVEHYIPCPEEGSPRMLILCPNDDLSREIEQELQSVARRLDLTIDLITEKGNSLKQRNDLYFGTEIIVGTVKKVNAMYLQNGFNVALLKLCVVLNAELIFSSGRKGDLVRLAESLPKKCLYLVHSEKKEEQRLTDFLEQYVANCVDLQ